MNSFLNFGKCKLLTYAEVISQDLDYVKWCCQLDDCSKAMQALKDY